MKCSDVRTFFSRIAEKSVSMQIQSADLDFFSANGYLSRMTKEDYDRASAEVSNLGQMSEALQNEEVEEKGAEVTLEEEEKKTHSILFHLEGKEKKEAELQREESEKEAVSKEEEEIAQRESAITDLIQKKSMIDRMVQYGDEYLALTGTGVVTLNDLNIRNYRVSDNEFSDFIQENKSITDELRAITGRGSFYVSSIRTGFPKADLSQLWSVSIGLAKLQGDQNQINTWFILALGILQHLKSTLENKMMAAEIISSLKAYPSQTAGSDSDPQSLAKSLVSLDKELRKSKVPKQLSAGVAATIMAGKRFDGTYPTDKFAEFKQITPSYESAAILSVMNVPSDQLTNKFQSFRSLFSSWGYSTSEDSELASAYLAISNLGPDDVRTKMNIIIDSLKNYLEYPLVAAAILTSIPTLEANETLDLMEKASSLLATVATGLQRSELISLAVRMIHGIRNELVKELDPTAKITNTPVQFTYASHPNFFFLYPPLIIVHSSYFSTYSGIGGFHPAHVHGVGGFAG